jgi:hypothetical protein
MKIKTTVQIIALVFLGAILLQASDYTVRQYLTLKELTKSTPVPKHYEGYDLRSYIAGLGAAFSWANAWTKMGGELWPGSKRDVVRDTNRLLGRGAPERPYCAPDDLDITVEQYTEILDSEIKRQLDSAAASPANERVQAKAMVFESFVGEVLLEGLQRNFSCSKAK